MEELRPEELEELVQELEEEARTDEKVGEASDPADEAARHLEQAFSLEDRDEYEEALEECDAAIRVDPTLADAHNLRGVILEELGRAEEAIMAYREALRLDPDFDAARDNLNAVEAELAAEKARHEAHRADGSISYEETMEESAEGPILFEPQKGDSAYEWLSGCVDLLPMAEAITVYEYPDAGLTITIPISEITGCEIVEREDIPYLRRGWSDRESGSNLGCLLVAGFITLFDRAVARASVFPSIKLTQATSGETGQGWVVHLRSKRRGRRGRVATFELAQRIAIFLRRSGYDGAIPRELSVPGEPEALATEAGALTDLEASLKRKWIVAGSLAVVLAWAAAVCFGSSVDSLVVGGTWNPFWLAERLPSILDGTSLSWGFCCTLPVLALGLFLLWIVGRRLIPGEQSRSSFIVAVILGVIIVLVGGCITGWFGVLYWYY